MSSRVIRRSEVSSHSSVSDGWVILGDEVYDVTKFIAFHPGGKYVLEQWLGKDATEVFRMYHNEFVLKKYDSRLKIGVLSEADRKESKKVDATLINKNAFGDFVPYGDPSWYQRLNSPYYQETHRRYRDRIRKFVDNEVIPFVPQWQDEDKPPKELYLKMGKEGFLAAMVGKPFPAKYVDKGTPYPEDFDYFHEAILYDELARCGYSPLVAAVTNGPAIAIGAVYRFGNDEQKAAFLPDVLMGRKYAALAVSEPGAGSDVANLACVARREGDHYVLNGNKKFITNGTYADLFVTGVRIEGSDSSHNNIAVFVIPSGLPGFNVRKMKVRAADMSGTAYLDFYNCKVPAKYLIGKEKDGWKYIMYNFNHERMYLIANVLRLSRVCLEESFKYAMKRKTFGKALHEHQAIRMKLSVMARRIESLQAWFDLIVYNLNTMSHQEASLKLGDIISLAKVEASKVYAICAHEATNIFGGNALVMDGPGWKVEPSVGQVKGYQIPGGAEDIMDDFAARTAIKLSKMVSKL